MRPPRALPRRPLAAVSGVVVLVGLLTVAGAARATPTTTTAPARAVSSGPQLQLRPSGSVTVSWRGNGHGHGMSQYGAQGAALRGLSAKQILHFYYPHTRLTRLPRSFIRVLLSNISSTYTTVLARGPGLALSGYGALPRRGYSMYRLVPWRDGLRLQGRHNGRWRVLTSTLGARADFHSAANWVQLLDYDGTSTRYHGKVGAVRNGAGELTINRVQLNQYVAGSVAGEVPASWRPAAVHAQAIAARSFAEFLRNLAGRGSRYDICDTTMCQSYVGMAHYDRAGNVIATENVRAVRGNRNVVLRYHGGPVLAQYSASDGGASVYGGYRYLVGKPDPYDSRASGDPYLDQSTSVRVASIAGAYGLRKVTSVRVTQRDGNGPWNGRVLTAVVGGVNSAGKKVRVHTDGDRLGAALGVWTNYLRLH
jgi:stage II sporulation protein D